MHHEQCNDIREDLDKHYYYYYLECFRKYVYVKALVKRKEKKGCILTFKIKKAKGCQRKRNFW